MIKSSSRRNAVGLTPCATLAENRLRMVVLGASGVGKTQLVSRFLDRPFNPTYLPTAEDFHRSKYIIRGRTYQLDVLDTAGHILSPVMQNLTILTGDLFIVVYSVIDRGSWERAKDIINLIEEVTSDPGRTNKCIERSFKSLLYPSGATTYKSDTFANGIQQQRKSPKTPLSIPIMLVGSKCDLDNVKVQSYEVAEWLRQRQTSSTSIVSQMNVSAKTNYNVQELYDRLFSLSCLPSELSPNMHRKVSEGVYSSNIVEAHDKLAPGWVMRPKSAEFCPDCKPRRRSFGLKTSHLRFVPGSRSSGSSAADSSSENEEAASSASNSNAIATICPNQRRPSVDTEVLLAFAKVRAYSPETQRKKKIDAKTSKVKKLRKHLMKLKISHPV